MVTWSVRATTFSFSRSLHSGGRWIESRLGHVFIWYHMWTCCIYLLLDCDMTLVEVSEKVEERLYWSSLDKQIWNYLPKIILQERKLVMIKKEQKERKREIKFLFSSSSLPQFWLYAVTILYIPRNGSKRYSKFLPNIQFRLSFSCCCSLQVIWKKLDQKSRIEKCSSSV